MYKVTKADLSGKTKDDAFEFMFEKGLKLSEMNKVWAELGDKKNRGGVFQNFLDFCAEKPQTESALADFLMSDKSSANEVRWFNQRNSIRKLSVTVYEKLGVEFKEKAATEAQHKAMEATVKAIPKRK